MCLALPFFLSFLLMKLTDGVNQMNLAIPVVPSLTVTSPTPEIPKSPVFASTSPPTVSKYAASASGASLDPTANHDGTETCSSLAPSLPECSHDGVDGLPRCSACERQWRACKLWYHSGEGGEHIIPAEDNASTRTTTGFLGLPDGSARGLGIEVGNGRRPPLNRQKADDWGRIRGFAASQRLTSVGQLPKRRRRSILEMRKFGIGVWRKVTRFIGVFDKRDRRSENLDRPEERVFPGSISISSTQRDTSLDSRFGRTERCGRGSFMTNDLTISRSRQPGGS